MFVLNVGALCTWWCTGQRWCTVVIDGMMLCGHNPHSWEQHHRPVWVHASAPCWDTHLGQAQACPDNPDPDPLVLPEPCPAALAATPAPSDSSPVSHESTALPDAAEPAWRVARRGQVLQAWPAAQPPGRRGSACCSGSTPRLQPGPEQHRSQSARHAGAGELGCQATLHRATGSTDSIFSTDWAAGVHTWAGVLLWQE